MTRCIRYSDGWKYRIEEETQIKTAIVGHICVTDWIRLDADGTLTLAKGYCWDGASGPAFDTPSFRRPSAAHDAFYQLLRLGLLPPGMRELADEEMHRLCLEDGMWRIRAWWCLRGVRLGAGPAADPANLASIKCAPGDCDGCHTPVPT